MGALYRKYRSRALNEVVGQEHVTKSLANALKSGRISHAYLLTGPRGVGKTSVARILAHAVNDLPYTDESSHLDIIEIDAASNRRIDEIRDLREKVHTVPTSARYKVYIIDEVHMLTREAFNALLKTLEEPPAHVIFILATTEPHKLPPTIISRTQRYNFRPIELDMAVGHLRSIAKREAISISDEALELLAEHGDGSFRDSISLLDQMAGTDKQITLPDVQAMLGMAPTVAIETLYEAVTKGSPKNVVTTVSDLREQGISAAMVAKQLGHYARQRLLDGEPTLLPEVATTLLKQLLNVPVSSDHDSWLEVVLLDTNFKLGSSVAPDTAPPQSTQSTPKLTDTKPHPVSKTQKQLPNTSKPPKAPNLDKAWQSLLDTLKQRHSTLFSVIRLAVPELHADRLIIACRFPFHQKRLNEAKNRQLLNEIVKQSFGKPLQLEFTLLQPRESETNADDTRDLESISNIFGSPELLES